MQLKSSLKDESVVLITPLIDIMFLILIFFVLNTSFTQKSSVDIEVPQAQSGIPTKKNELFISLTADHRIYINEREADFGSFSTLLLDIIGDIEEPEIIIEGDKGISYDFLMGIMDRVRVLGYEKISLVVSN